MEGLSELGDLKTEHWKRLQDMASRFEAAWHDSDTVDLTAFLPPPEDPLRRVALHELIKTDLEARWRRGQIIGVEAYLERFPELGTTADLSPSLIYEEYRVRHLHGDKPPLGGYERRFGRRFAEFKRLIGEQPLPDIAATPNPPTGDPQPVASQQTLRIGGEYKMIRFINSGGFAEVWQAETPAGFPVAIKRILRPLDHAEAQVELRALGEIKQLRHPFLLQTRDYGLLDNRLYIVMDLAECTLADRLRQCQAAGETGIPLDELLRYIHEAAEAIDYMHGKKVHHRDIKPKNILLDGGHAKVADFGLARMVQSQRLTVTGSGTAPYMAPEVWRRQVHELSDLYSLAVTYAELGLGRLPFAGTDMYSLMMDHIEGRPDLGNLSEAEQVVLRKALSKDPDHRHITCMQFVKELEEALETELDSSPQVGSLRRPSVRKHRPAPREDGESHTLVPCDTPVTPLDVPPSLQAESSNQKPATHPAPIDRPTPAHGNRRDQGRGGTPATDQTLIPGRGEPVPGEDESHFDLNMPVPGRAKVEEALVQSPKPRGKKRSSLLPRLVAVGVIISATLLVGAIYSGTKKTAETSSASSSDDGKDSGGNAGTQQSGGQSTGTTNGGNSGGTGVRPPEKPAFVDPLNKFDLSVSSSDWPSASKHLQDLRTALGLAPDKEAEGRVKASLQIAGKKIREGYIKLDQPTDIHSWVDTITNFPIPVRTFDLTWVDCKAYAKEPNYTQFFNGLAKLTDLEIKEHDSDLDDLFDELEKTTIQKLPSQRIAKLEALVNALKQPGALLPDLVKKKTRSRLVKSVNSLTDERYAKLEKPKDFKDMLEFTGLAFDQDRVTAITVACHIECLLRQGANGLAGKDDPGYKLACQLADNNDTLRDSMDRYAGYVRGLIWRVRGEVNQAAGQFKIAFRSKDGWDNGRLRLAAETSFEVGKLKRAGGNPHQALVEFDEAARLHPEPTPLPNAVVTVQTAFEAENDKIAARLDRLLRRNDFKDVTPSDLASIGRSYADWADQHESAAEMLLERLVKTLRAASEQPNATDSVFYWLGVHESNNGKQKQAQKAFSDALARCDAKQLFSSKTGHLGREGRLGRIKDRINFNDKDEDSAQLVVSLITPAMLANGNERNERYWTLLAKRDWLIVNHKKLLKKELEQETPPFLDHAKELLSHNKERRYLRALTHKLIITAVFNGFDWKLVSDAQQKKIFLEAHREHAIKWANLFLDSGPEIFDEWRGALDDAKDCVDILHNYGKPDPALKKAGDPAMMNLGDDLEKKCGKPGVQGPSEQHRLEISSPTTKQNT